MKYLGTRAPIDTPIWGCAYSKDSNEKTMGLKKEPVLGIIKEEGNYYFYELKRNGDIKKSSKVYSCSRVYADTEEESIELYNEKIDNQIFLLQSLINDCIKDKIFIY